MRVNEIKGQIDFYTDALFQNGYDMGWNAVLEELDQLSDRAWNEKNPTVAETIRWAVNQVRGESVSEIQTLIHKSSVIAYNQGAKDERERIIKALQNEETAQALTFVARNTAEENPRVIQDQAWLRIEQLIKGEQK